MDKIGDLLYTERRKKGLEIADVEHATGISGVYLNALEQSRYDVLPGEVYVKGFLRNYANYLGLDGSHLVQLYSDKKKNWRGCSGSAVRCRACGTGRQKSECGDHPIRRQEKMEHSPCGRNFGRIGAGIVSLAEIRCTGRRNPEKRRQFKNARRSRPECEFAGSHRSCRNKFRSSIRVPARCPDGPLH